jgi:hypothetical protein
VSYWAKADRQSAAFSAMVEAEDQLRRALQLLSDLPNSRERKRQEFELQVTLAMALMESKGHVHPQVTEVLGHARSLIAETEARAQSFTSRFYMGCGSPNTSAASEPRHSTRLTNSYHLPSLKNNPD